MPHNSEIRQLVFTVKDLCRMCFTCVRECPVKAIRIANGQAEVISERCIGCGNCVRVCRQGAKNFVRHTHQVLDMLDSGKRLVAMVAPSFPAEFTELDHPGRLVGMLRALGFEKVTEVAFGADLVARSYRSLFLDNNHGAVISSDCPAIVYYVEHYHPELTPHLAPVVSPMVAAARNLLRKYGDDITVVFFGPCIAKKAESDEVRYALTFTELREMLAIKGIGYEDCEIAGFDPPLAGKGSVFPISHGLLQNMDVAADLTRGDVVVAEGRVNIKDAINEFAHGVLNARHLELLCCEGCIMGPGMSPKGNKYERRSQVSAYVSAKLENFDRQAWEAELEEAKSLDLSTSFEARDRRLQRPDNEAINAVLQKFGKTKPSDLLDCGACGYDSCIEHAVAVLQGLAEDEMCLPYTIEKLHQSIEHLNLSNAELASAREALRQSEKLAHMGQLSAGIAHELNNPLGVITMYSNLLLDDAPDDQMRNDLQLIVEQAERCRKIVGGLLNFARKNQLRLVETNVESLVNRSLQSVVIPPAVAVEVEVDLTDPFAFIDADQMMQVLTNLEKNAVEAMPEGGILRVRIGEKNEEITISIADTGTGISPENMDRIFTPFFTTKEVGKGTGLGLPLCYGIVKMHKGQINVTSNDQPEKGPTGTTFTIVLPRKPI
ncbi:MAG TPA: [Fe-Fe] hydrogenase large subunit C-terminal domain-containing protein [Bacteroidales bacterium]|nr:[Fe-Fe] hydrogenase large subunit C-terminal domain-containing protein [Bacteroidales bacterium]